MNDPAPASAPPSVSASRPPLARRLLAELLGTGLLVAIVVGSGIAAQRLSSTDVGLQLLQNSLATGLGLAVLILILGPVSGAHFNPVVSVIDWLLGRADRSGMPLRELGPTVLAQIAGGLGGALLAGAMFGVAPAVSTTVRAGGGLLIAEVVATAGLVLVIFALVRTDRLTLVAPAVGAYIAAAYWFTSSTSFANPAVTIGRTITDTFAGISPASAPLFLLAQLLGAAVGLFLVVVLFPRERGAVLREDESDR